MMSNYRPRSQRSLGESLHHSETRNPFDYLQHDATRPSTSRSTQSGVVPTFDFTSSPAPPARRSQRRTSPVPSLSSFARFKENGFGIQLEPPRPVRKGPGSLHDLPSPNEWVRSPICEHCGSITPRSGTTTIYGTPVKEHRSFLSRPASPSSTRPSSPFPFSDEKSLLDQDPLCLVEKVHDRDDVNFLPGWKRKLHKLTPVFSMLAIAAYWTYFSFRIKCTRDAEIKAHRRYVMAWIFIAVEFGVAMPMLLHQFWQCFLFKSRFREKLRVVGNETPTVDVFVTCCGEDRTIILDTVRAAADQDWPIDRFRVVVLDDKHDRELETEINEMSTTNPHIFYHARAKIPGVPHHFKAGNLNNGLEFVEKLEGGKGEYMAALDADMIPEPEWLRAIIAHLVVDPKLALSCPPQLFYNVPKNDPLLQSLNGFVHIAEPVKDAAGVAWCTGSGYGIRRSALEQIGCFPTGSLAEDVYTSSMLLGAGWKTAYVHEALQFGTVPDSFVGHMKQRIRWTIGTLQTSLKLNFCLWGPLVANMTLFQRLSGFVYTISSLFTIFLTTSLLTMPIVLISGGTLVPYADYAQLRWLVRLCFIALASNRLNEWVTYIPAGYRLGQRESAAMIWMAPFQAIAIVRSFFLPTWLGGKTAAFSSSGSITCELNEREARTRAPLLARLRVILVDCMAGMHLVYIAFAVAAVAISIARAFTENTISLDPASPDVKDVMVYLLTHAAWPPVLWLVCLVSCWAPIGYAIWPPTMPDREELLDRDPATGVAHPKASAKVLRWGTKNVLHEVLYGGLTAYTCVIFVGSWFVAL